MLNAVKTVKRAVIAGAIVAMSALAVPAMASAAFPEWDPAGAATGAGNLTMTLQGGHNISCDVVAGVDLQNNGILDMDGGTVGASTPLNCVSNTGCAVTVTVAGTGSTLPWPITKFSNDPSQVGIRNVAFAISYASVGCPLNGLNFVAFGDLVGDYDGSAGILSFDAAPGITTALGSAVVDGEVEILNDATGLPVGLS